MEKPPHRLLLLFLKLLGMSLVTMLLPMFLLFALPVTCACVSIRLVLICLYNVRNNILMTILTIPVGILCILMSFCLGFGLNIFAIPLALLALGISSWIYLGIMLLK
jgi:hypothetical protein